jgi:hypothetical protein
MRYLAFVIALSLPGCSGVVICCSDSAKVETAPEFTVNRTGGAMTEDVLNEAIHHSAGGGSPPPQKPPFLNR